MPRSSIYKTLFFWTIQIGLLIFLNSFITIGIKNSTYSHYYKVNAICEGSMKPEIAVFGSSVGEVGVNSIELENRTKMTCYNFSIDGTRFLQYNGLLKEHMQRNKNLKLVILAETVLGLEKNNALTAVDRYLAHTNNDNVYQSLRDVQPDLAFKVRYIPFYKFIVMDHPYYKASAVGWMNKIMKSWPEDKYKGYTPKTVTWQMDADDINRQADLYKLSIDSMILDRYQETVHELSSRNIMTLIVFMPIQTDGQRIMLNMDIYRNVFNGLTSDKVKFLDLTIDTMCRDKKYFYNNSHVNTQGSEFVSTRISDFLQKM